MNLVWRFYMDQAHRWRWQHLAIDRTVVAESAKGFGDYEDCLTDAKNSGYVFHPSHARLVQGGRSR